MDVKTQIKWTLNWLDLISIEKTWQTIEKDGCTFSVVYSLLEMKSKVYIYIYIYIVENIFKIPWSM